jgi:hypothetical protein
MSVLKRRADDIIPLQNCNKSSVTVVPQLVKKSPTSYGIPRFITVLTTAQALPSFQQLPSTSCLPRGLFPSGFPTENFQIFLFPTSAMFPANLILLDLTIQILSREQHHDTKR